MLHAEHPRGRDCLTRLAGGRSYRGNGRASARQGRGICSHVHLVRARATPPRRSLTSRPLRGMQGLRLRQKGVPRPSVASRIGGIVDARRWLLPALIARLQRELTVITATTCHHRLTLGLGPTAAARRRPDGMTPALSLVEWPSHLRAGPQGQCGRHRLDGRDADCGRPLAASTRRCASAWFFKSCRHKRPARLQPQPAAADRSGSPCAALGARLASVAHGRGLDPTGGRS